MSQLLNETYSESIIESKVREYSLVQNEEKDISNNPFMLVGNFIRNQATELQNNTMSKVFIRSLMPIPEVFIVINKSITKKQTRFWNEFISNWERESDGNIEVCVGNEDLWKRSAKRYGWKEFNI